MKKKSLSTFILTILLIVCTSLSNVSDGLSNINIMAQSAIVMDMDTGEVIASKNANIQRPVASTMKLLTSLIYAENISKGQMIPFTEEALKTTQTSLNNLKKINVGDKISSDDLMKAVLVHSANDAAYLMADAVSGNYKDFVQIMNDRVKSLGLENTYVVNPCGLESNALDPYNREINLSTAYDMAVIAMEAYKNSWIKETISQGSDNMTIDIEGEAIPIKLRNKILGKDGNVGGKTGNETQAGHCFVGFFQRDGRNLVTVALGCDYGDGTNVFNDTNNIADYGYLAEKEVFKEVGEEIGTIDLEYRTYGIVGPKKSITVPIILTQDVMYYKNDINDEYAKIDYSGKSKSAWKLASKEVDFDFILPNYQSKVTGKVGISKLDLIKIYAISLTKFIVAGFILVFTVAYCIRLRNLRRKRNRMKRRKSNRNNTRVNKNYKRRR